MVLILYERDCGGETKATEEIIKRIVYDDRVNIKVYARKPLLKNDFFGFLSWLIISIIGWVLIIFKNRKTDWIYTTTYTSGVAAAILKFFIGSKLCFHYHGSRIPHRNNRKKGIHRLSQKISHKVVSDLHRFFLKRSELIMVPSFFSKNYLVNEFYSLEINKKIAVIPNGINLTRFASGNKEIKNNLRHILRVKNNTKVILSIGRLNSLKNIHILIKAGIIFKLKKLNILIMIAYPKLVREEEFKYKKYLLKLVKQLKLQKNILWVEDEKNIPRLYQLSDIVISLSAQENLPLIMLESLVTKTLFASVPAGGVNSILEKVDQRLILEFDNEIILAERITRLLKLPGKEKNFIVKRGYSIAKQFTWNKSANLILQKMLNF